MIGYPSPMDKSNIPWHVVATRLGLLGETQAWLARELGTGTNTISNWKKRGEVPVDRAKEVARALGCSTDALLNPHVSANHNSAHTDEPKRRQNSRVFTAPEKTHALTISESLESDVGEELRLRAGRAIAVVGEVQAGPDGFISIDDYPVGHGHAQLREVRSRDKGAYGLKVRGDSMRPRIKAGEYIVCEPNSEAQPGDDVVVRFADGGAVVKELLWVRDGDVCLGSINNGIAPITRPLAEIAYIHRVAAIMPRGAAVELDDY